MDLRLKSVRSCRILKFKFNQLKGDMKMNTYYTLKLVLDYCKQIDRNGSWDEVLNNLVTGDSTIIEELDILENTLTEWISEEKSCGIVHSETPYHLELVKMMKEVY